MSLHHPVDESSMVVYPLHDRCRAKQPLRIGLFCEKRPMWIRHPTSLQHPMNEASRVVYSLYVPLSCHPPAPMNQVKKF